MAKTGAKKPAKRASAPLSERVDLELASSAYAKRAEGKTPSAREVAALRRIEGASEAAYRWKLYRSVPRKDLAEMLGVIPLNVKRWAAKFDIPVGSARTVDLPAVLRAMYDRTWNRGGNGISSAEASKPLDEVRSLDAERKRLELDRYRGTLIPVEDLANGRATIARIFRTAGEILERNHGTDAATVIREALDECDREFESMFATKGIADVDDRNREPETASE